MECELIPIDYDYFDFEGKNYVSVIGRTKRGKRVCVVDLYEANFWVILKDGVYSKNIERLVSKIEGIETKKGAREARVLKTEICRKKFLGKDVDAIRVYVTNHKDCHLIASEIGNSDDIIARREYDIPIITKYIMEGGLEPMKWCSVTGETLGDMDLGGIVDGLDVDLCLKLEKQKGLDLDKFEPRVLAYDIETDSLELGKGNILMISLFGKGIRKVLTWKKSKKKQDYVEFFRNEGDMIEGFVKYVHEYSPDILCGYFSDGFDLPYLKERAKKNKVKLELGLDSNEPKFSRGIFPTGKIMGIVHVDLYRFVSAIYSQYLAGESLSLNEVAGELIGEKKEDFDFNLLHDMDDKNWYDFFSYSLRDSEVTYKLFLKIWPDLLEFTRIIKEPTFDVSRDRMAAHVENHILHNLSRFNEIAEKRPGHGESNERKMKGKFEGAFVYEPKPGLYENLVMFDFTSMHASIIVSFNISKSTLRFTDEGDSYESPGFDLNGHKIKVFFKKEPGFFSVLLGEVVEKRKKYKKEYSINKNAMAKARSNAYKLLANATFGYQGFYGARYYSREAAAATLAYVRKFTNDTMENIRKQGHEIIYGDTDSIMFLQDKKNKDEILKLLNGINDKLPGIMELDLEGFFKRAIFVSKRGVSTGAKKKYALIDEEKRMKIRGFETVRRDWCRLSRDLQSDVLKTILIDGNEEKALLLVRNIVKDLEKRRVDVGKLIIKTQLKKPIVEYVSEGPHVVAAKKMEKMGTIVSSGMIVEYFVGEGKGKRIGDRVLLPNEKGNYDVDYYLNNQILPAVENVFDVFGVNVDEELKDSKQMTLF